MYVPLTSSSCLFSLPSLRYMTADHGYDDKKLYEYNKKTLRMDSLSSKKTQKHSQREAGACIQYGFLI
jgi:hypothetical protein